VLNYEYDDVSSALKEMTGGRGPDACIDAVGMESHGFGIASWYDKAKQAVMLQTDRPTALREAIQACRKGGTISIPGVYGGIIDKLPLGAAFNKALTLKMGQTHVQRYLPKLLDYIEQGGIDPSFVITHRLSLEQAPEGYQIFKDKQQECIKVVLKP
jgi:threonine dehydrogenase-like Zn-dependent dehydrogenase